MSLGRLHSVFDRARSGCEHNASFKSVNTQNKHGGSIRSHDSYLKRYVKNSLTQHSFYVTKSRVSSNCTRNIHRPSISWRSFIPLPYVLRQRRQRSFEHDFSPFLRWNFLRFSGPLNIFVSFLVGLLIKKFIQPNLRWTKKKQNREETGLTTPIFSAFKWLAGQIWQIVETMRFQ